MLDNGDLLFLKGHELKNSAERGKRKSMLEFPHMAPLKSFVEQIRMDFKRQAPDFDPCDGGINARALFLLEAPGPRALASGFISRNNPDPTARNTLNLFACTRLPREKPFPGISSPGIPKGWIRRKKSGRQNPTWLNCWVCCQNSKP